MANRKHNQWIDKKLFVVTFKGRKPRALFWRKDVYKEWFEYAKLHGTYPSGFGNLSKFNFADWWKHPKYGFELFCEPYIEDCILPVKNATAYLKEERHLLFDVDLDTDIDKLVFKFQNILIKHNAKAYTKSRATFQPSKPMKNIKLYDAEHEHNVKKGLPIRLSNPRNVYKLTQQGITQTEIAYKLGFYSGIATHKDPVTNSIVFSMPITNEEVYKWKLATAGKGNTKNQVYKEAYKDDACELRYKSAIRRVARDLKQCKAIFKNIEKGTFP